MTVRPHPSFHGTVLTAPRRHRLARLTRWYPRIRHVPIDRLLLGGQNGVPASRFASVYGDPRWPSRPVVSGPHADLLARAASGELADDEILASSYGRMALACIGHTGRYFAATDPAGVITQARQFMTRADDARAPVPSGDHHSVPGVPILVVAIADSDCYQVLDGHHRVAQLARSGVTSVAVRVRRGTVTTPLQDLLRSMSWLEGGRELYQPVSSPELEAAWPTVRRCADRLDKMTAFLVGRGFDEPGTTYLDVASCYGWFVDQMASLGYGAEGIERDPQGAVLGKVVYGLDPGRIHIGDAETVLRRTSKQWDVVSCFSLLHHFVLGRGSCDAAELVRRLDQATGRVLFLDTGQEHERWFRSSLRGWDSEHVATFLREHATFDEIVDLGPDEDAVAPYDANYGRHLFACVRSA